MKKAHVISIFSALLFMFVSGIALADEEFGPGVYDDECDDPMLMVDMEKCCDREADEASRLETARSILQVHARTVGDPPVPEDDDHYHIAINGWAVDGSGRDGVGIRWCGLPGNHTVQFRPPGNVGLPGQDIRMVFGYGIDHL